MSDPAIKRLSGRVVYENRWMRVCEDQVRFADGQTGIYGVVEKTDFALIVPQHADGRFQMVQQYRYPVAQRFWEFPQGAWETRPDVDPEALARAELREETGFEAATLEPLGRLFPSYGFCTQPVHIFLARGLTHVGICREAEEQDMISAAFTLSDIRQMIAEGQVRDGPTVSALGLMALSGKLPGISS